MFSNQTLQMENGSLMIFPTTLTPVMSAEAVIVSLLGLALNSVFLWALVRCKPVRDQTHFPYLVSIMGRFS